MAVLRRMVEESFELVLAFNIVTVLLYLTIFSGTFTQSSYVYHDEQDALILPWIVILAPTLLCVIETMLD